LTTVEFLSTLRRLDVQLYADGDRLRCNAPRGALTPALEVEVARRKAEILTYLREVQGAKRASLPRIRSVPRDGDLPLSFAQQRLWFLEQLQPDSAAYHVSVACRLTGTLDVPLLAQSLDEIVRQHEALRTTFASVEGRPFQVIVSHLALPLPVVYLRELPAIARRAEVQRLTIEEAQKPFDLANGPLLRATLLWLAEAEHMLLLTMHHIISDGWSIGLFFRQMAALYKALSTGKSPVLPRLSIQYADFAYWQRQWLQGEVLETLLAYWKQRLAGAPTVLELLTDRPRSPVQTFRSGQQSLVLSQALSVSLKALSRKEGVTLFMMLLTAFTVLLHRYTGEDDILVGSPIAGRTRPETEPLIGFFANTLVLRTDLSGNPPFKQLLQRVREVALGAYAHQELPFALLVEAIQPERDLSRTPLFQVSFTMLNVVASQIELPGLTIEPLSAGERSARFDLSLYAREHQEGIQLVFVYNTDLFEDATIARMLEHFQTLMEGISVDPEQHLSTLPFLTASQRQQFLVRRNIVHPANPFVKFENQEIEQSIPTRFEQQVKKYPEKVAIKTKDRAWTYRALNLLANHVARAILTRYGNGEARVALLFDHDSFMIASVLGVLKAGKTYIPLDPLYPKERLTYILEDSQAGVILTHDRHVTLAKALAEDTRQIINVDAIALSEPIENTNLPISPDALAYILYTSGSTGRPKGVMQNHRNVLYFIRTYTNSLHLSAGDRLTLLFAYVSDGAVMDIFGGLLNGATLYPFDLRVEELTQLAAWLQQEAITIYHSTPTVYRHFVRTLTGAEHFPALRLVVLGGEAVYRPDVDVYKQHFPPDCLLVNGLGPTESTLALQYFIDRHTEVGRHAVPVGYRVEGTEILLLNDEGETVEGYGVGEIAIRSPHIALGYWRQLIPTAAAFRPSPAGGDKRIYHTGDLGRWLPDGSLEFVGRKDWQVKVRGHRVELGEIETTLCQHPAIHEAVVVAREEGLSEVRLVAYVVPGQASAPTSGELRRWLQAKLPSYMLPSAYVRLDGLPLTSSGKIDREVLPVPDQARPKLDEVFVAPRTSTEEMLSGIWAIVLGMDHVGVHDNFFDLGGHSLLAVQVMARLREAVQVEVPLRALFEAPTVASLALYLETAREAEQPVLAPPLQLRPPGEAEAASIAQEHFWVLDQVFYGLPVFNIPYVLRLEGALNAAVLEQSFNEIIRRHEVLRTTFAPVEGRLVQVIAPTWHMPLPVIDCCALPYTERHDEARRVVQEESQHPFDLARGPLLRTFLLRLGDQEHLLLVTLHHIIGDGWSLGVLTHELAVLYDALAAGRPSPLPALPIQYADFAHWQGQWRHNAMLEAQLAYWKDQLHDPLPTLELPTDRARGTDLHVRTASQPLEIPNTLFEALKHRSLQEGSTPFMTCLAAFKILLYGYTGQEDVRVATLVANRTRPETEGIIGLFVNTVILRTNLGGNPTLREVLQRVRATTLAAYAHQDLSFEELVRTLERERNLQRASLCQVMVIWQNAMLRPLQFSAQRLRFLTTEQNVVAANVALTTFDIVLILRERPQGLTGTCIYKADLFDAATISGVLGNFQDVLSCLSTQPERALATFRSLHDRRG
jgi:amino acid adenylation domain-containing protein